MDDLLVDARSGVLTSLELHIRSDMPTGWVGWAARVADTRNFGGSGSLFRADPYGFGASIRDDAAARGAATGEAVERYCGNVVPEDLVRGSASALELAGSRVVDPAEFALYSEDQYRLPGFPFVPFTSDLNIRWVLGHTMDEKVPTYVPAALTYLGYYTGARRGEPPIASLQYAGIAAGRSRAEAEMSALLELLERDATALWWCGDRSQPAIELSDWERLPAHRLLGDLESQTRSVRVLLLPSPFGIPVAAVWIRDDRRGLVALGTACRPTMEAAVSKALVEAYAVLAITIDLADPDGPDLAQRGGRNAAGAPVQTLSGRPSLPGRVRSAMERHRRSADRRPTLSRSRDGPGRRGTSLRLHRNTLGIRDSRRSAVGSGFSRSASDVTGTPADFRRSHHRRHLDCRVARRPHPDSGPVQQRPGSLSPSWKVAD